MLNMNPFQAIMGHGAPSGGMPSSGGMMPNIFQQAQQLMQRFQNPQQMVQQYFPDAPAEVSGDPGQLLQWMQQTGKVNPQMVQMAQSMLGRR